MSSLICMTVLLVNISGQDFGVDRRDMNSYKRVVNTCKTDERYKNDTPCLTKFMKREPGVYWALCGPKQLAPADE